MRTYYFPNILKKIHVGFMSMFKDLQVAKYDATGTIINMRQVPLTFGHKGKEISIAQKKDKRNYSTFLPRMAVMMSGITPAAEKNRGGHLVELCKYTEAGADTLEKLYGGYPYKINYTLTILTEHMGEASQILEQILPSFVPFRNVTIREFDFLPEFTRDIPILLDSVTPTFQDETAEDEIKRIEFDLEFSVDCMFYRPILTTDIIKTVKVNLIDSSLVPDITGNDLTSYNYAVSGDDESDFVVLDDTWTDVI